MLPISTMIMSLLLSSIASSSCNKKLLGFICCICCLSSGVVLVVADDVNVKDDQNGSWLYERSVVRGVSQVMDIAWMPDGTKHHALVSVKNGAIWYYKNGDLEQDQHPRKKVLQLDPCNSQEMALQSIAIHPQFGTKPKDTTTTTYDYVYTYFSTPATENGDCTPIENVVGKDRPFENIDVAKSPYNKVSRFVFNFEKEVLENEEVILVTGNANKMHNGGGMAFGNDGYLYLATGDAGYPREYDPANNLDNLWGSILRIQDDGTVPDSNPYVTDPLAARCGTQITNPGNGKDRICSEIFARGLRNPFSLEMNPNTSKDIVEYHVSDVGRSLWEEINIGGTGYEKVNYGWREREGPCEMGRVDSNECAEVDSKEYQDPLYFIPHPDSDGCAIVGGAFVPNGIWPKEFDNEYLYSELRGRGIFHLLSDPENECRGTKCKEQKPAYIPIPIVDNIDGRGSLRLRFGPYSKNGSADKNQLSLYHVQYDSGHINRLTYIKTKNNDDDNAADDKDDDENDSSDSIPVDYSPNQKPSAVIQTMYSSNHNGVTVFFDGSESTTDSEKKNDDALSYKWDFGDDANGGIYNVLVSTNGAASYTYKNPGLYEATLTVTNEEGLESSKEFREITVDEDFMRSSDTDFGEATLKVFEWDTNCNNGDDGDNTVIDLCGVLEFCYDEVTDTYGYHQKEYNGGSSYSSSSCHTSVKKGAAPVLRMTAGKTYRLTVRNLSRTPTNIHTHGLHVVGSGSGDDVTRIVPSQSCLDYIYDLRSDHPGGTYWYHPHAHAHSEQQVNGGAAGLLIIEDSDENSGNNIPSWITNELLLQVVRLDGGESMLSNGRSNEIFNVIPGKWYRLRVSTVDPLGVSQELKFTDGCDVHKVASDGVWHTVVPFDDDDLDEKARNGIYPMSGSSRGDFAIRCNADTVDFINVLYGNKLSAIINVKTSGSTSNLRNELGRWVPNRPLSIRSMMDEDVPEENQFAIQVSRDSINKRYWDKDIPVKQLAYNEVQEWELPNTVSHPFHTHLYHMQIVEEGGCGDGYKEGEFYDTICTDQPCRVRFRTSDFGQRLVVHCHVMLHSDLGSMAWFDVQGKGMPLYETVSPNYDCKDDGPPSLSLPEFPVVPKVNFAPKNTVVPVEDDNDEPPQKKPSFVEGLVPPITWGAMDYDEAYKIPVPESEKESTFSAYCMDMNKNDKQHIDDGVFLLRKGDDTCTDRDGSECTIAHWGPGESLSYKFSIPKSGKYTIRIRAASGQPGRVVALDLLAPQFPPSLVASDTAALSRTKAFGYRVASLGEDDTSDDGDNHGHEEEYQYSHGERILIDSKSVTIPGLDGWQDYYDLVWESIELEPNVYTLQVTSETGKANLCSVAIFEVSFR